LLHVHRIYLKSESLRAAQYNIKYYGLNSLNESTEKVVRQYGELEEYCVLYRFDWGDSVDRRERNVDETDGMRSKARYGTIRSAMHQFNHLTNHNTPVPIQLKQDKVTKLTNRLN